MNFKLTGRVGTVTKGESQPKRAVFCTFFQHKCIISPIVAPIYKICKQKVKTDHHYVIIEADFPSTHPKMGKHRSPLRTLS